MLSWHCNLLFPDSINVNTLYYEELKWKWSVLVTSKQEPNPWPENSWVLCSRSRGAPWVQPGKLCGLHRGQSRRGDLQWDVQGDGRGGGPARLHPLQPHPPPVPRLQGDPDGEGGQCVRPGSGHDGGGQLKTRPFILQYLALAEQDTWAAEEAKSFLSNSINWPRFLHQASFRDLAISLEGSILKI